MPDQSVSHYEQFTSQEVQTIPLTLDFLPTALFSIKSLSFHFSFALNVKASRLLDKSEVLVEKGSGKLRAGILDDITFCPGTLQSGEFP